MTTLAPKPSVRSWTVWTTSRSRALMVWVAPNLRAQSSLVLSVSTAMIRLAPTSAAPAIAASPTPPQPITATVSIRSAALAGPALASHRAPVQDHEGARLDRGHARPDGFDRARGLMAVQEWVLV